MMNRKIIVTIIEMVNPKIYVLSNNVKISIEKLHNVGNFLTKNLYFFLSSFQNFLEDKFAFN